MRIVVVFVNYGPYHMARAAALAKRECDAWFVELAASQKRYPWKPEKHNFGGRLFTLEPRAAYEDSNRRDLRRKLIKVLERIAPDAVAVAGYDELPMRAAAYWARRHNAGLVMMSETTARDEPHPRWRELAKSLWLRRYVDAALVGGKPHREYMRTLGIPDDRIWEGYDVVDNEYFASASASARRDEEYLRAQLGLTRKYFLYVGRFAPEKNLPFLLRSYQLYRKAQTSGWPLVLVGDGLQRRELERLVRELSIPVVWLGFAQIDLLPAYYAFAGCFVLASTKEPWGLVVNEAMASGLPVLVSDRCGCATDLVEDGRNGFRFDCDDPEVLSELMARISSMNAQELSKMAAESFEIIANWTPDTWAEHLVSAAQAACAQKKRKARAACLHAASSNP